MLSDVAGGKYLQVHGGSTAAYINKNYGSDQFMTGDMRYDIDSQVIKVFDGKNWQSLYGGTATINLTNEAQQLFEWVKDKRDQEQQLLELAKAHPALQDALEALQRAEEQVKIVTALVQE